MITLSSWAVKYGVPDVAMRELADVLTSAASDNGQTGSAESGVVKVVRLEAPKVGARLWRNNSGAGKLDNGSFVRWGLCNESKGMNAVIKSSDLIGLRPVTIGPQHVGTVLGQFIARECKAPGWKYSGSDREKAQLNFLTLVEALGGDAKFCSSGGTL